MLAQLKNEKQAIDNFLISFLYEQEKFFANQDLSKEAFARIKAFVVSGKTVRGGLFLLAAKSLNEKNYQENQADFLTIAAAIELMHSSILIHDDIIDQDEKRRGQDSVWHQYQKDAIKQNHQDPKNYGQSLAICLGNIINFLASSTLERLATLPQKTQSQIKQTISQEIIRTNFAEMLDSKITLQATLPAQGEVSEMYLFKTARYTFALPLVLAALASDLEKSQIKLLEAISESLGLIFQIVDDSISIFASEEVSGKSYVSDIREGKRTLFYLTLLEEVTNKEKQFLLKKYGQKNLTTKEIAEIQKLFQQFAKTKVDQILNKFREKAQTDISKIKSKKTRLLLTDILEFNLTRNS